MTNEKADRVMAEGDSRVLYRRRWVGEKSNGVETEAIAGPWSELQYSVTFAGWEMEDFHVDMYSRDRYIIY